MKEVLIISQAARGNRKALEKLVRLYYEKIYNYIGYRVQDFSAAEDLTQDVFVKLIRHIHSYVPTASFSAFLYRIAHNTVVDYYRTTKHTETIPETLQADDPLPAAEARMDVERMLAKLSEEQRECIILYYLQGLTYREISLVLGIPVPTAKSRVQRGLAACKKIMEEKS